MKKEMLKVIRLNLTFFMCCLKKLAWHRRCWHTQSPGEVPRAVLTIPISRSLMKFPRLVWMLMNRVSAVCRSPCSHWGVLPIPMWERSLLCVWKFCSLPSCRAGSPGPPNDEQSTLGHDFTYDFIYFFHLKHAVLSCSSISGVPSARGCCAWS